MLRYVALLGVALIATANSTRAGVVQLEFRCQDGFTSGPLQGVPVSFTVTFNGATGYQDGFESQMDYYDVRTTALLVAGDSVLVDQEGRTHAFLATDEGLDYIGLALPSTVIFGVGAQFSTADPEGPLWSLPFQSHGCGIDRAFLEGLFVPRAFDPYYEPSFVRFNGASATLTELEVSFVPLAPACMTGLAGMGCLATTRVMARTRTRRAVR